jgi:hypothetical protein
LLILDEICKKNYPRNFSDPKVFLAKTIKLNFFQAKIISDQKHLSKLQNFQPIFFYLTKTFFQQFSSDQNWISEQQICPAKKCLQPIQFSKKKSLQLNLILKFNQS